MEVLHGLARADDGTCNRMMLDVMACNEACNEACNKACNGLVLDVMACNESCNQACNGMVLDVMACNQACTSCYVIEHVM